MTARVEHIGLATLYLGDALELLPTIGAVDHAVFDPPYEALMHASKNSKPVVRIDGGRDLSKLDFAPIDEIRAQVVEVAAPLVGGWFIAFCTSEGVGRWADCINSSSMK